MFFVLSKTLGYLVVPSNLVMAIGLAGLVLLCTRFRRLASWLIVSSVVLIALLGYSPVGRMLLLPLEDRFPPWDASRGPPTGIVVLGGAISAEVSVARGVVALNGAAERITVAAELAHRYPDARIIFSSGSGSLDATAPLEAPLAASHMPRAIAVFRAAGFVVEAYPVNWRTRGWRDAAQLFGSLAEGLTITDAAVHEWVGLAAYRLTGRTAEFFPAP